MRRTVPPAGGHVQLRFGHINPDKDLCPRHPILLGGPALLDMGSTAQVTVQALLVEGHDDLGCPPVFADRGTVGLSCPS